MEFGPLGLAVIQKDESHINRILDTQPNSLLTERDVFGNTPFHLALDWPQGLRLLLSAVGKAEDLGNACAPPFFWGEGADQFEGIKLLLHSGASFPRATACRSEIEQSIEWLFKCDFAVFEMVVLTLQQRRKKLLELFVAHSKDLLTCELNFSSVNLLDGQALPVQRLLMDNNIPVPIALQVSLEWTTMYHHIPLWIDSPARCDYIYSAGFRDIDGRFGAEWTPLERIASDYPVDDQFSKMIWLIDKGACVDTTFAWPIDAPWQQIDYPLLNLISWALVGPIADSVLVALGQSEKLVLRTDTSCSPCEHSSSQDWRPDITVKNNTLVVLVEPRMDLLLRSCLNSERRDHCICSCSSGACTPASIMLKRIYDPDFDIETARRVRYADDCPSSEVRRRQLVHLCEVRPRQILRALFPLLAGDRGQVIWSLNIIRFETFATLRLTHTCCWNDTRKGAGSLDPGDVAEVRDEEEEGLNRLEELMEEFEAKFLQLRNDDFDAIDFLERYWATRMNEELAEKPMDPDTVRNIEDIGVVLEKDSRDYSEGIYPDVEAWPRYRYYERPHSIRKLEP